MGQGTGEVWTWPRPSSARRAGRAGWSSSTSQGEAHVPVAPAQGAMLLSVLLHMYCCCRALHSNFEPQTGSPIVMLQRAASAAERVFEILDAQPDVDDKKNAIELPTIQGDIKFDNVVFSYDEEKNALNGVSFAVKAGQMIGLSGPSEQGRLPLST